MEENEKPNFDIENATMQDYQNIVIQQKKYLGFKWDDKVYEGFLLAEEVGELLSCIRRSLKGCAVDDASRKETYKNHIEEELADCLAYILSIANQHEVDMEKAFKNKMKKNLDRKWKRKEKNNT